MCLHLVGCDRLYSKYQWPKPLMSVQELLLGKRFRYQRKVKESKVYYSKIQGVLVGFLTVEIATIMREF